MAPIYTITAADVASVDASSRLTEAVMFDWGAQLIQVPASVNSVGPQWIVDNCRFAEATFVGAARPAIVAASGKVQTGTDPDTLAPILTGITPVLQDNWTIETLKTTGTFQITDIFNPSYTGSTGLPPYVDTAGVDIRYRQTTNAVIAEISTGSGLNAEQAQQLSSLAALLESSGLFAAAAFANLSTFLESDRTRLTELTKILGLFQGVTVSYQDPTDSTDGYVRTSDGLNRTISRNGAVDTISRDA